jgi:hypothetical protein
MAIENIQRSRRAVLTGLGGGVAALVAQALGRPLPALAEGENIKVGGQHGTARSPTVLRNRVNAEEVFVARSDSYGTALEGHSGGVAVYGEGSLAVYGVSPPQNGVGVRGQCFGGIGVEAVSDDGIGIWAYALRGVALQVDTGRIRVPSVSRVATIEAGRSAVTVHAPVDVVEDSFVLLTPRTNLRGRDLWYTTDPEADTFTIHISEPRTNPTAVAWLLLG